MKPQRTVVAGEVQTDAAVGGEPLAGLADAPTMELFFQLFPTPPVPVGLLSLFVVVVVRQGPTPSSVQTQEGARDVARNQPGQLPQVLLVVDGGQIRVSVPAVLPGVGPRFGLVDEVEQTFAEG